MYVQCSCDICVMCVRCAYDVRLMCMWCVWDVHGMCVRCGCDVHAMGMQGVCDLHAMGVQWACDVCGMCMQFAWDVRTICVWWACNVKWCAWDLRTMWVGWACDVHETYMWYVLDVHMMCMWCVLDVCVWAMRMSSECNLHMMCRQQTWLLKYFSSIAAVKIGKKKSVFNHLLRNDWTHFFFANFYCSDRWKVLYRAVGNWSHELAVRKNVIKILDFSINAKLFSWLSKK